MIQQSGGDARAAFYAAAQEKGVDPNVIINQMKGYGNLGTLATSIMANNPRAKTLLSLFSSTK